MDKKLIQQVVGFPFHRSILAWAERPLELPLQPLLTKQSLKLIVCSGLSDPANLGSIIRTAAAFGISAVISDEQCADPFSRKALRASMGAALELPILKVADLAELVKSLQKQGVDCIASIINSQQHLRDFEVKGSWALFVGNEGYGLSQETITLCDHSISIAMEEAIVDSLNVANASAIMLWKLCQ